MQAPLTVRALSSAFRNPRGLLAVSKSVVSGGAVSATSAVKLISTSANAGLPVRHAFPAVATTMMSGRTAAAVPERAFSSAPAANPAAPSISHDASALLAISPIDGRYSTSTSALGPYFSEFALIKYRVIVEIRWLQFMAGTLPDLPALSAEANTVLNTIITKFSVEDAARVKAIEKVTRHDVKAVEYFLKERVAQNAELKKRAEYLHFACTSEDINNLAYALMLKDAREKVILPKMGALIDVLSDMAATNASIPMLSRTHGQPASPTTVGKELANFAVRLARQRKTFQDTVIMGKFSGAVGNFNAHMSAYPEVDWPALAEKFVEQSLGLKFASYSTQIEFHDYIAELFDAVSRFNTILLDFNRDMWGYISLGYWKLAAVSGEIGSSTMPHKVNPIDFENSEGNVGLANAVFSHLAAKLPVSRFQRDLSDSTVMRNIGVGLGYSLVAYNSSLLGLKKVTVNNAALQKDLEGNWEVIAEPVQTVLRRHGIEGAYEQLKDLTRGKKVDGAAMAAFIDTLPLPPAERARLAQITPANYIGNAEKQALDAKAYIQKL